MPDRRPHILVWSSVFPSATHPNIGPFVRERMFRVGRQLPISVVSPQPWFPLQWLVRLVRPQFRPRMPRYECMSGVDVYRPRYLSVPGLFKSWDGDLMALGAARTVRRLKRHGRVDVLDAHFAYPDGYAAAKVGQKLSLPVSLTMRGTEVRHAIDPKLKPKLNAALNGADRVFAVSNSLRRLAMGLGVAEQKIQVVGNGVDSQTFRPIPKDIARRNLGIANDSRVLITVGGLVERKGFHRVIDCLPVLLRKLSNVHYLVVGGGGPEGDFSARLRKQISDLGLSDRVRFLGALPPDEIREALSASDAFVLASSNEGWANVLLEAMACGLPVVATDVGGNAEVVSSPDLGIVVPFGDSQALLSALSDALVRSWDREEIRAYATRNDWSQRTECLVAEFERLCHQGGDENRPRSTDACQ